MKRSTLERSSCLSSATLSWWPQSTSLWCFQSECLFSTPLPLSPSLWPIGSIRSWVSDLVSTWFPFSPQVLQDTIISSSWLLRDDSHDNQVQLDPSLYHWIPHVLQLSHSARHLDWRNPISVGLPYPLWVDPPLFRVCHLGKVNMQQTIHEEIQNLWEED